MDVIPRNDYGERCQFDAYCKLVLYHEAIDYLREMQRRRDRELSFSDLSQAEMDKLYTVDSYPSDRFTFSSPRPTDMTCISTMSLWRMPLPVCPPRRRAF